MRLQGRDVTFNGGDSLHKKSKFLNRYMVGGLARQFLQLCIDCVKLGPYNGGYGVCGVCGCKLRWRRWQWGLTVVEESTSFIDGDVVRISVLDSVLPAGEDWALCRACDMVRLHPSGALGWMYTRRGSGMILGIFAAFVARLTVLLYVSKSPTFKALERPGNELLYRQDLMSYCH